jgi:hypothetical protein
MSSLEFERQSPMVDSQTMQDRRVQIMDVHGILGDVVAELVGYPMRIPAPDATSGSPKREAARVMVAPVVLGR